MSFREIMDYSQEYAEEIRSNLQLANFNYSVQKSAESKKAQVNKYLSFV